jgi:hypothetical protein
MNGDKLAHDIIFGEFSKQQSALDFVHLPCKFYSKCSIECILQDKLGRTISTAAHSVDENTDSISIDISRCSAGDFHAWIFINDMTFVRHFKVEKKEKPKFLGQFMKMFS